ncbi:glycosyltransferase involved in cell wall biosynthesis [Bacillus sp. AG1163]|uniref:glycosyltransferase family 2 protein n=1 Tax=Bacillus sp. AG1163 TaxID=2183999 RepID=UPI0010E3D10A|nr:glycosyltransferase [Bacillus sp. AG1163]TDT79869.1 glycosyltransferase involved in cell wall biosynthesis [Bacillus sp. AG1163]
MLVTIGLPVYNCEKTVLNTIKSILAQTYEKWELIIVDDGSNDKSLEIINSIKDSRIRIYSDGKNKGLPYRLNQIAELAKGVYIARMDSDDIMHPERLEKQVAFLLENSEVDVVGTNAYTIDENNNIVGERKRRSSIIDFHEVLAKGLFIHPTIMGKTQWFRNNRYSEKYVRAEDHEMWVRTFEQSNFSIMLESLLYYREPSTVNLKNYRLSCKTDRMIFKEYGPNKIGGMATYKLILKSKSKEILYWIVNSIGRGKLLLKTRNNTLSREEVENNHMLLKKILEA